MSTIITGPYAALVLSAGLTNDQANAALEALRVNGYELVVSASQSEARALLGSALHQSLPSDDAIITEHVRDAYKLLGGRP